MVREDVYVYECKSCITGQASHRSLWKYHFQGAKGLLFAVDSSDRQRLPEAKRELLELLQVL